MAESTYWSDDRRYAVRISDDVITTMVQLCIQATSNETGGILVGQYTEDLKYAQILTASRAPRDSHGGPMWFFRGVRSLQRWIDIMWSRQHQYYLGEWHFHPGGVSRPSLTDIRQMEQIAGSPDYRCPEPILLIIAGNVMHKWEVGVYVFPYNLRYLELHLTHTNQQGGDSNALR